MAPEVVRHGKYSANADTFSFAMIVNELFTEEKPYEFLIPLEAAVGVVKRGLRPSQKRIKSERLRCIIARAWDQDPDRRPFWPEIIAELEAAREEMCPSDGSRPRKVSQQARRAADAGAGGFLGGAAPSGDRPTAGVAVVRGGSAHASGSLGAGAKPTIGALFRRFGSGGRPGRSADGKEKKSAEDKPRKAGHNLPMDEEHQA
jgi:hypothetical protein